MAIHEDFKKSIQKLLGMREEDLGDEDLKDIADEVAPEGDTNPKESDPTAADAPSEDPAEASPEPSAENNDAEAPPADTEDDDLSGATPEAPESEQVAGTGDEITVQETDDNSKVSSMFNDIGKPETDYGFTNPNNIRLAKFRFKKAGIAIETLMTDVENKLGLTSDKLIFRLTPEQYDSYKEKGRDLRTKFEPLGKREKNMIIFNSRIPIYYLDKNTGKVQKVDDSNPNMMKNAFNKIDEFMIKRFGEHWVDDMNAVDFLQGIKVNFTEKESITPNMITTKFFEGEEEKLIPFNKLYVKMPKSVEDFVKENKDNQNFLRSSVYRAIASGYLESSTDSNGVFPVLMSDEAPADEETSTDADVGGVEGDVGDAEGDAAADEAIADLGLDEPDVEAAPGEEAPPTEEPVAPPEI